ncbi:hypothetical protein KP509_1Z325600 [Ceratopteris richardii]|nr:hypothetical protein KP509_1Z325600 [Ceratopteris richardii]
MTSSEEIATFAQELLAEHNRLRDQFGGVNDLELDAELSSKAQAHADSLAARQCKLENSTDESVGENLYYLESDDGKYTAKHIVDYWLRRSNFDHKTKPRTTNHFTQIVWKSSEKLGVGVSRAANGAVYVAAFYSPRGNVVNYLDENVLMKDAAQTDAGAGSSSDNQNDVRMNLKLFKIKIYNKF